MPEDGSSPGTVLLTGATGFVGQRLQRYLLDQNYPIRVLVRHNSPRSANVDPRAERIEGSLEDSQALGRALAGCKAVINCAGAVRGKTWADFADVNILGVRSLANAIKRLSAQPALLHISSLAASRPDLSDYADSKRQGEEVLEEFTELLWTVFRPPAIYGPGDVEMRPMLNMVRRGIVVVPGGKRTQRLSLLHVDDLASAVGVWLGAPARFRHYSFELDDGHAKGYDWTEILEAVCDKPLLGRPVFLPVPAGLLNICGKVNEQLAGLTRKKPMLTTGKAHELCEAEWLCDNTAFARSSGWQPTIQLKQGASALYSSPDA